MSTSKMVPCKFLRHWRIYNAGEIAGFGPKVAKSLAEADPPVAVILEQAAAAPDVAKPKKKRASK